MKPLRMLILYELQAMNKKIRIITLMRVLMTLMTIMKWLSISVDERKIIIREHRIAKEEAVTTVRDR